MVCTIDDYINYKHKMYYRHYNCIVIIFLLISTDIRVKRLFISIKESDIDKIGLGVRRMYQ